MNLLTRWPLRVTLPLMLLGGLLVLLLMQFNAFRQSALATMEDETREDLLYELTSLHNELQQALSAVPPQTLLEWNIRSFENQFHWREAVVVDGSGVVLLSLHTPSLGKLARDVLPVPVAAFPSEHGDLIQTRHVPPYLLGAMAVPLDGGGVGRLLVVEDLGGERLGIVANVQQQVLVGGGPMLLLGLLAWWLFQRAITGRMGRFIAAESRLIAGDLSVRLNLSGGDELARMGHAFDALIERLGREESRIQEKDYLFGTILLHSPVMVFFKDAQGRYLLGNRFLAEQAGCDEAALCGKSDAQLWPEHVAQMLAEHDRQTLEAGASQVFEETLGHNGGGRHYLTVRFPLEPLRKGGARLGGIATDITQRRVMELGLRRKDELIACLAYSAERFLSTEAWGGEIADVLQHLGRAAETAQVFLYQEERGLIHQWREGAGVSTRQVALDALGLRWWKGALRHEGVLIRDEPHFTPSERAILTPESIQTLLLVPIATKEGWWGFLALGCEMPRRWRGGEIKALQAHAGLIGAVAARQNASRDLARSEGRFRAIFEQSGIGMVVSSRAGRILAVNPAFARMLGYHPQQMIGWGFSAITHPEDNASNQDLFVRFSAGEIDQYGMEKRYLSRDGRTVWGRLMVRALREEGEGAILALIEDITPQKEMAQSLEQVEARYRNIIATSNEGFVAVDLGLHVVEVNDAMLRILGYKRGEVEGVRVVRFVAKPYWGQLRRWSRHPEEIPQREIELTAFHRQGYPIDLLLSISTLHHEGRLEGFVAFASDLGQRKRLDQAILAAKVFERTSEAVVITDGDANIVDVNDAWERVTGYQREDVIGQNPRIMRSGRHDEAFYRQMWRALLEVGRWEGEIWDRRKDGEEYPKHLVIDAVRGETGAVTHYVGIFTDITEAKAREDHLHHMAHRDALTGLPNRLLFQDRLGQAMRRAHRSGELLALLFLDLDGFKAINDQLGHRVGDAVLIEVARRLTQAVRQTDTVCRLGGDEFTVLLGEIEGMMGGRLVAENILTTLAAPIETEAGGQHVTVSIGIAFYPGDGETKEGLIQAADLAMYRAKALGKNRYHLAGDYTATDEKRV